MWPNYNGFFFEISKGAICAGNVFEDCDQAVFVLNSSNVEIYNNTFVNSTVCIRRDLRSAVNDHFGWHPSSGPDVDQRFGHVLVNNLLVGDKSFSVPFLAVGQHQDLCSKLKDPQLKRLDYNVIIRNAESKGDVIANWSPSKSSEQGKCDQSIKVIEDLNSVLDMASAHNLFYSEMNLQVFQSRELHNYSMLGSFQSANQATAIPLAIQKILGISGKVSPYIGAYPKR
jgi:hypothetical protein